MFRAMIAPAVFCVVLAGLLRSETIPEQTGEAALREARRLAAQYRFNDAAELFRRAERTGANVSEARYGHAVALLNVQPLRAANIAQAARILDELIEGHGPGDLPVAARYFRARISHQHQNPADPADAAQRYAELFRDHPNHPLGQLALVKLALVRIYDPTDHTPRQAMLADLANHAAEFTDAVARRDMYLLLGNAVLFFDLPPELALAHLQAAWASGIQGHASRGNVLVTIGELARELGQDDVARFHYELFLHTHQRDNRAHTIRQRLAAITDAVSDAEEKKQP